MLGEERVPALWHRRFPEARSAKMGPNFGTVELALLTVELAYHWIGIRVSVVAVSCSDG